MKKIGLMGTLYVAVFLICTVIFVLLFHIPIFNQLDVFLYRGAIFLIVCSAIAFALMMLAKKKFKSLRLSIKDGILIVSLFFSITLSWFIVAPVTVERSISVFMLSYMDENRTDTGMTEEEFGDIFYDKYIQRLSAFGKRFHEQKISGNIEPVADGNGYVLTKRGELLVNMFRLCAKLFGTEKWLVYPNEYIG